MPSFNDDDENPHFWTWRKLLMTIAPLIPTDPTSAEFKAMSVLWSRLIDKRKTFKRVVPGGHYAKRQADEIARIAEEIERRGLLPRRGNVGKPAELGDIEPSAEPIDMEEYNRRMDAIFGKGERPK